MSALKSYLLCFALLASAVLVLPASGAEKPKWPFRLKLRPVEMPSVPGSVQLELSIKSLDSRFRDSVLTVEVETYDGMQYYGPSVLLPDLNDQDSSSLVLDVVLAPDTVNGLMVAVRQYFYQRVAVFFKTYGDSVEYFGGFLQERDRGRPVKQPERVLGGWIEGQFPHLDSIYKPIWDSIAAEKQAYKDSIYRKHGIDTVHTKKSEKKARSKQ